MPAEALIFDVQRFSVHDGPGIRSTVFFKGCPLRCRWCQNPESLRREPELSFAADRCKSSGECVRACPRQALLEPHSPSKDRVLRERCDGCGLCLSACAFGALRVVGRKVSSEGLLEEILRDRPFFEASGGGVTLSGGEPTLQLEFIADFASRCARESLRVGLQTCGAFRFEAFSPHLPLFDFIQFDLKAIDPDLHRSLTGADNRAILENARKLLLAGAPVAFRMPVIPRLTDLPENLSAVAAFLRELAVPRLHLLKYHAMGESKLPRVGFPLEPLEIDSKTAAASFTRAVELLRSEGLEVTT